MYAVNQGNSCYLHSHDLRIYATQDPQEFTPEANKPTNNALKYHNRLFASEANSHTNCYSINKKRGKEFAKDS